MAEVNTNVFEEAKHVADTLSGSVTLMQYIESVKYHYGRVRQQLQSGQHYEHAEAAFAELQEQLPYLLCSYAVVRAFSKADNGRPVKIGKEAVKLEIEAMRKEILDGWAIRQGEAIKSFPAECFKSDGTHNQGRVDGHHMIISSVLLSIMSTHDLKDGGFGYRHDETSPFHLVESRGGEFVMPADVLKQLQQQMGRSYV